MNFLMTETKTLSGGPDGQFIFKWHQADKNESREYLLLFGNSLFVSINIDGRDCCQAGQFSQDVADEALTLWKNLTFRQCLRVM